MNPQAPSQRHPDSPSPDALLREHLSALADGEADPHATGVACDAWRTDAQARRTWHAYQLIGDVLRSDELATRPSRDAAFLAGLRERLAQEPVVLAPEPLPSPVAVARLPRRAAQRWLAPAAIAAGFVAVAGVLVVTRMNPLDAAGSGVVLAGRSAQGSPQALANAPSDARPSASGAAMLRDAELDLYINAHQAARRAGAMTLPGSALRSVELVVPAVKQP